MAMRPRAVAPDWSENHHRGPAKCRTVAPEPGGDVFFEKSAVALAICNGLDDGIICPRRTECLRVAMVNAEAYGIWGGMTPRARLDMRLRHPGMPERWSWQPEVPQAPEDMQWLNAS